MREMCEGHAGDSEFIIVELDFDHNAKKWDVRGIFLSAHCLGNSDGRCKWYRGTGLQQFEWIESPEGFNTPVVWIARGSHAAYPTRASCDSGFWLFDTCDGNRLRIRFPVRTKLQNIGSRSNPFMGETDCVAPGRGGWRSALADSTLKECFWMPNKPFRGWQRSRAGTAPTPYDRHLREAASF
ncbi:MAG: hypothetical protein WKF55_01005 [Gemmatimonadaceae bacterium]